MLKNFKIKVLNIEQAKKIILILNTYGINTGLAKDLEGITRLSYPRIFFIKHLFISHSSLEFEDQNNKEYGPEFTIEDILKL